MTTKSVLRLAGLCLLMLAVFACASGGGGSGSSGGTAAQAGKQGAVEELPHIEADIEVFPQMGHLEYINSIAYSPDGRQALSGSSDKTVRLWDTATGREIRIFTGHESGVSSVAFSPDGKQVLSGAGIDDTSSDRTVRLWDVATGEVIRTFVGHTGPVKSVTFSPDGRRVLSSGRANLKLWDVATGREIITFTGNTASVYSVAFSPDGRQVLSGSSDNTMKLWDAATGGEIRTFTGHKSYISSVAFSPDGKQILSGSSEGEYPSRGVVKLWDVTTGREIRTLTGHTESVASVAFSPDGTQIISCAHQTVKLWDAVTGREIRNITGHTRDINATVNSVAFSPDGKQILSCCGRDRTIKLWDTDTGKEIRSFATGHIASVLSVAFSSDGRQVITGSWDGSIKLWDKDTGRVIRTFAGHESSNYPWVNSVVFSPDGKQALSGSQDWTVKLWDVATGREIRTYNGNASNVYSVAFSPDGKLILSGHNARDLNGTIKLWDATTGREIKTFTTDIGAVRSVAFSPDGRQAVSGSVSRFYSSSSSTSSSGTTTWVNADKTVILWDVATGNEIRSFSGHARASVSSVAFSPDGRHILSGASDRTVKLWDAGTGSEIRTFTGHTSSVTSVMFSSDGRQVLSGSSDRTVKLWNATTGGEIRTFTGHTSSVPSVAFSPDGKYIISSSYDNTTRLWDVSTGKEIAQFISFSGTDTQLAAATRGLTVETQTAAASNDSEWLSITPDGYYQASPRGDRYLNVRVNATVSSIDSYRSVFYNPDVVQARLQGRPDPASKRNITIQQAAAFTPPQVTIQSPANFSTTNTATVNLSVAIVDQNQPLQNIKILVNGRLVGRSELSAIQGSSGLQPQRASLTVTGNQKTVNFNLPITLDPGPNIIEVVAFNGYSESPRIPVEVTWNAPAGQRPALPNLWILAVGVNGYQDTNIRNLNFCVADAKGVVDALKAQEGRRYAKVNSLLIADGEAQAPTADNIRRSLAFLDQAGERDVVLLFLAGHGVSDNAGKFLFLPNDTRMNRNNTVAEASAITDGDIVKVLDRAGNLLVFIDACQSGGVDNDRLVRSLMDTNAFVFTSSRGNELSQERVDLGHGVFTYSVMEGLRGAVAAQAQGNVTVLSLSGFVSQDVPRRTNGAQNPKAYSLGFYDFPMAVIRQRAMSNEE